MTSSFLLSPSQEQEQIIQHLHDGYNIIVNSVAGSGKTTTSLHVALRFPQLRVLLLTYNARLKEETRERCQQLNIFNMEVHSYHAMGVKHYHPSCFRDTGIRFTVENDIQTSTLQQYDIMIIDEAQDMTRLYYSLICKILRDHRSSYGVDPQILIIGDENQCIFRFNGSDSRYLTLADDIMTLQQSLSPSASPWKRLKLSVSYRLTGNMAMFVNEVERIQQMCINNLQVMLGRRNIIPHKSAGLPIYYCIGSPFDTQAVLVREMLNLIRANLIRAEDIFVLAPTLKANYDRKTPVKLFENALVDAHIPVYVPTSDDPYIQADCAHGKVIFSTFHQSKGLERKIVIVFGFDNSYFSYCGRDYDPSYCPCPLYVAATRATDLVCFVAESGNDNRGSVLQHYNAPLKFLNRSRLDTLAQCTPSVVRIVKISKAYAHREVMYFPPSGFIMKEIQSYMNISQATKKESIHLTSDDQSYVALPVEMDLSPIAKPCVSVAEVLPFLHLILPDDKTDQLTATDLTHWLPEPTMSGAKAMLCPILMQYPSSRPIHLASTTLGFENRVEYVAEINGLAIPAMLEVRSTANSQDPQCSMYEQLRCVLNDMHPVIKERFLALKQPHRDASASYYLELAAIYLAGASINSRGYISKALQLASFDWLSDKKAEECLGVLCAAVTDHVEAKFEVELHEQLSWRDTRSVLIQGQIDILTPTAIWEVKCVNALTDENFLQLAVYGWLWNRTKRTTHGERRFRLLNVVTSEVYELQCYDAAGDDMLDKVIDQMLMHHFRSNATCSDEEFREAAAAAAVSRPNFSVDIHALYAKKEVELGFESTSAVTGAQLQKIEEQLIQNRALKHGAVENASCANRKKIKREKSVTDI